MKHRFAFVVFLLCFCFFAVAVDAASAVQAEAGLSMFWSILWIFVGGMALNLTPCVYPMIPITISYFSAKSLA